MAIPTARGAVRSARTQPADGPSPWQTSGHYEFRFGVHELRLTGLRLDDLVGEEAEFSLVEEGPLLLLAYRFGQMVPWSCAAFEGRSRDGCPPPVGGPFEERALLSVILTGRDAPARINYTLSLDFTRALHQAIRERLRSSFDPAGAALALDRLCHRWPSVHALVSKSRLRTVGRP